jgi:hypothetical protein
MPNPSFKLATRILARAVFADPRILKAWCSVVCEKKSVHAFNAAIK